ncbi:MAG: agmatine deiminase family protein [Candidatus Cloacimonetes bacterium]|nr:agmatine deiminase family protein [Candidatus Cloacimonadota bacterium]MDY0172867.1 agmatine deiminase family protein [Candidatus Cloacimonadaceae bacterium]
MQHDSITITSGSASFSAITAGGSRNVSFTLSVDSSMAAGALASLSFTATAGAYSASKSEALPVGDPEQITIGNGTSQQQHPLNRYYTYSAHEAIYLAGEVGMAGAIKSMAYYKASGTNVDPIEAITVYMKNTTASSLASGNYSTTGYTQVYSGNWPNTSTTGWMEIDLNQRFAYDGMSNLSILIVKGNQAWTSVYPQWNYSSTGTSTRVRQNQNDSSQPTSLSGTSNLPNLRLKIFPAAGVLYPPRDLAGSATHGAVTLSWQAPVIGTPTGYKIYKNNSALTTVTALTYRDAAVTDGTNYSYKVSALYGSEESEATNTISATPNMYAPTNLVAIGGNSVVQLTWTAAAGREIDETVTFNAKDRVINSYKIYKDGVALTTVSGNSYTDNAVTNGTAYSYHVTTLYTNPAGESAASNTATATPNMVTEVIIGTGTSVTSTSEASPLNIYYRSMHGQSVYTAAELNAAGMIGAVNITQLGFYVNTAPASALPAFIIRMKHSSDSDVANWQTLADMQTVYSNTAYMPIAGGYQMLTLNTPFLWNGVDNIVIDTAFDRVSSYNSSGTTQFTSMTNGYRYARSDGADQTNVFTGSSTSSSRPNVKLLFVPLSQDYAAISVNPSSISETVSSGSSISRQITISNTGTDDLNWSIPERNLSSRNITGSTFNCTTNTYVPGSTATWTFTMHNATTDAEWIKDIQITFPPTVAVTSVGSFVGGGNPLVASPQNGTGVTINWHYESSYGYGGIQAGETASATVNVSISAAASGNLNLPWIVTGDDYGSEPHSFSGTHILNQAGEPQPDDWYSISSHSGSIAPGTDAIITVLLDSEGLADGTYSSSFNIESNSMFNSSLNIPVSLTVFTPVNPYPTEPRFVAEWEPAQGAVVRYPWGQPFSLLRDLSNEALLYVIVSSSNQSTATSNLQSNSVNMANVRYVNAATDSYWTRDYAPWTILDADHNMHLVDFNYNRPRPSDNLIPSVLASHLNLNLYDLDMNHTGGNMMTDGMGKAMSTTLVLSENSSLSQAQINQRFSDILGVTDYFMYADPLANSSIDHIDCHAKLLDVDKVMIARVPSGHANYAALEATVAFWQSKTSSYGAPYQIFRVNQSSDNEPYANSFIFNKKIFVPQANPSPSSYDTAAIAAYQAAMPGYIVQGYYDSSFISDDAVHCRVNTIFDNQMISVRHQPVSDLTAYQEYTLTVEIDHVNALNPTDSFIAWSTSSSGPWQHSSLSHTGANTYSASLSTAGHLQNIYYWIQAKDTTGRITTLPLCAGLDPFVASVTDSGSLDAPVVTITQNGSNRILTWEAITGATSYRVESSDDPYTNFSLAGSTANTTYSVPATPTRRFFRVFAVTEPASTKH